MDHPPAWRPAPRPGSEDCEACGGLGIVAVTDLGDVSWLEADTPPDQWQYCWECQGETRRT